MPMSSLVPMAIRLFSASTDSSEVLSAFWTLKVLVVSVEPLLIVVSPLTLSVLSSLIVVF